MNNLQPNEEARLTGKPYGAIGFSQGNPVMSLIPVFPGSTFTVSIASAILSASPVTETYTVVDGDTFLTICGKVANQFAQNGVFSSAGMIAVNDFGSGPNGQPNNASQLVTFPIVSFMAPFPGQAFTITVTGSGQTIPQIVQQGIPLNPSLTSNLTYPPTVVWGYLPICNYLEDQMVGSVSDNLAVYKGNNATLRVSEMKDRQKLFKMYCNRMAVYLGIMKNPDNGAITNSMTIGNWSIV